MSKEIKPIHIRVDASTACQLNCPACPRAAPESKIEPGFLKFLDFKELVDKNPWIHDIELSNWGEIFLNPDLLKIIKYAYKKNIVLTADNGVNLNTVTDEILEALVKYKFANIRCSIDGASQETYSIYRKNGNFWKVIKNIKRLNYYKNKYKSELPVLTWQFIIFGHNTHEIGPARQMAKDLNMLFFLKLSYDDLYTDLFSPVKDADRDLIRRETGLGVSDRKEYLEKTGKEYMERMCAQLWLRPQINFDGKVFGCCVNYWGDFGNAFQEGLSKCLNNEKMNYARQMLLGLKESREDIPCTICKFYKSRKKRADWIKPDDIKEPAKKARLSIMVKILLSPAGLKRALRKIGDRISRWKVFI